MLSGGARRLAALYAVKPGDTAVVATTGDRGLDAALALHAAGVRVVAVADLRPDAGGGEPAARVEAAGIELMRGATVVRALGRQAVTGAVLAPVDARRPLAGGPRAPHPVRPDRRLGRIAPATSLLLQGGAKARYDEATAAASSPRACNDIVLAAGSVAGHEDADERRALGPRRRRRGRARARAPARGARGRDAARERARAGPLAPERPSRAGAGRDAAGGRARPQQGRQGVRRPRRGRHGQGHRATPPPRATTRSSSPSATRR